MLGIWATILGVDYRLVRDAVKYEIPRPKPEIIRILNEIEDN